MLNNIRKFASTKLAGVLVGIIIVPFVLWGMGGVFSGGNKNNIAKISNESISTVDFQNHLNSLNIELEKIKKNKENKNFFDENNKFSRIKYEKFLLLNNITAPDFEFTNPVNGPLEVD